MQIFRMPCVRLTAVSLLSLGTTIGTRGDDGSSAVSRQTQIRALAPVVVLASGFKELSAVAVEASGAVLVTDRDKGTLTRIDSAGRRTRLLTDLRAPTGVAVEPSGGVLVVERGGKRLLRLSSDGRISVVASGLKQPRAVAVGPDGHTWVSMRRTIGRNEDDDDDDRTEGGSESMVVRLDESGAVIPFAAGFIDVRALAADSAAVYVVIARLAAERGRVRTTVARIPIRADGSAGLVEPVLRNAPHRPLGVAIDAIGDVFVSSVADDDDDGGGEPGGMILKRRMGGELSTLAAALHDPVALAFAPDGALIAVERRAPGRVLRFEPAPAPIVAALSFTNQSPVFLPGRADPGDLVQVFDANGANRLAEATADAISGQFALRTPIDLNAETRLSFVATAAGGAGLVGPAATSRIVHDDHLPSVVMTHPLPGAHVRGAVILRARGADEGSGVASMSFMRDELVAATIQNAAPGQPFVATTTLETTALTEGPHALTVEAVDRAGNSAATAQRLVVDRTPPDTEILTGPPRETAERTAIFMFSGADVQSANVEFAWRLDGSLWSAFSASPVIELTSMTPGIHRFEVKARDRAGNEDPTPAAQTFTVTALRIRILEPAPGAVITTATIWVRGIVESGARDVTVTIPLPPELRNELSLEVLPAATEAGTFAAEVPAAPSMTTVTVIARDSEGATSTDVVSVGVQSPLSGSTRFGAFPASGFAPHAARFSEDAFPPGSFYSLDLESDGTIDYEGDTLSDR